RVQNQVENHLLDLTAVRPDVAEIGSPVNQQLDLLAQQAPQHAFAIADDLIHTDDARLRDLAAAEREQLPGQRDGPVGGLQDLLRVPPQWVEWGQLRKQQRIVPGDDG